MIAHGDSQQCQQALYPCVGDEKEDAIEQGALQK